MEGRTEIIPRCQEAIAGPSGCDLYVPLGERDREKFPEGGARMLVVQPIDYDEFHEDMVNLINDYVKRLGRKNAERGESKIRGGKHFQPGRTPIDRLADFLMK